MTSTRQQPFGQLPRLLVIAALLLLCGQLAWRLVGPRWRALQQERQDREEERQAEAAARREVASFIESQQEEWQLTKSQPGRLIVLAPHESSPSLEIEDYVSWGNTDFQGGCVKMLFDGRYLEEECPEGHPRYSGDRTLQCEPDCRTVQFTAGDREVSFFLYATYSHAEVGDLTPERPTLNVLVRRGETLGIQMKPQRRSPDPHDLHWRVQGDVCVFIKIDRPVHTGRTTCSDGWSTQQSSERTLDRDGLLSEMTSNVDEVPWIFFNPLDQDATIELHATFARTREGRKESDEVDPFSFLFPRSG